MEFNFMNKKVSITNAVEQTRDMTTFAEKGITLLTTYKSNKATIDQKILDNEEWYKSQHWEKIRKSASANDPEPVTAYLFNTLANKHADVMDNFPKPNLLPKEKDDEEEAKRLTEIVPIIMDNFRETYSNAAWRKLKHGFTIYGVFWNKELENNYGDIDVKDLDPLKVFWESGITDIQKSQNLFVTDLIDDDILKEEYPEYKKYFNGTKPIDVSQYRTNENVDTTNKSLMIDWYYFKKNKQGKKVLHLAKIVNNVVLYASEFDEENVELQQNGIYNHGMYPVVIDVLFPEDGSCVGFGYIDIIKSPQMYIDKLDQIISKNALIAGKVRYLVKKDGGINPEHVADFSNEVIEVEGGVGEENFRQVQGKPLDGFIVNHRQEKISELKDTSGVNEFNRGSGGSGVTAAQAIAMLQEAGNKLSRDMISMSYFNYKKIVALVIELIRQNYTESRPFRVPVSDEDRKTDPELRSEKYKYVKYRNDGLQDKPVAPFYEGEELEEGYQERYRKVCLDIKIVPEKQSPFSQAAHNEMAKEMYNMGFFTPSTEAYLASSIALEMMNFEGKEKVMEMMRENVNIMEKLQQGMMAMQENEKLKTIVQTVTGQDMGVSLPQQAAPGQPGPVNDGNIPT